METPNPAQTFLVEAADLLDQVEEVVLEVEKNPGESEQVNRLFRAFHTIKGSGAMFGFDHVAAFTHHVESLLDQLRQGTIPVSPQLVAAILAARDHIQRLLGTNGDDPKLATIGESLVADLQALSADRSTGPDKASGIEPPATAHAGATETILIRFRPGPDLPSSGLDPTLLLSELRSLGDCRVSLDSASVPGLGELDSTRCHMAWEIELTTDRGINAVRDVFIFAEHNSELSISVPAPRSALPLSRTASPAAASAAAEPTPRTPKAPDQDQTAATTGESKVIKDGVVRVPSRKLDHLVSLVGELVMNESRLSRVATRLNDLELSAPVESFERLIAELRDAVLGIRMMPIGSTFTRFKRLVHDLSRDLGKDVELVTEGAETELDKTVLDQLADPLVHLIRNSVDHGIETPADRIAVGKPARGTVRLTATHEGSQVVVSIADDGRGLDLAAIRAHAIEKQLITPDAVLADSEIHKLIFLPGFSTASQVTSVSGRGVGMDVVRRQIDGLRGTIQLTSTQGKGTCVSLALPLTLAIIEGLLVTIDNDPYIIPMSAVTENVELQQADRARHNGRNLIAVRGELVPYIDLRELFQVRGVRPAIEKIVIVRLGQDRVGLVVDTVLGSHQTVIQSLGRVLKGIDVASGCTILGDGRVALILAVPGVVAAAGNSAGRGCPTTLAAA